MMRAMKCSLLLCLALGSDAAKQSCCQKKEVGDLVYLLFKDDPSLTLDYGCKDGCVYKGQQDPNLMVCFRTGPLPVECLAGGFHWSYSDADGTGPGFWGTEFEGCNGQSQSPIDIPSPPDTPSPEVTPLVMTNYDKVRIKILSNSAEHYETGEKRLTEGTFKNNGHTAQLDVVTTLPEDVGLLTGGPLEGEYKILQLHFHWGATDSLGSEHTLAGERFPLELHIVHVKKGEADPLNTPRGLAVTGFFFTIDAADNEALTPLVAELAEIRDPKSQIAMENSDFKISDLVSGVAPVGGAPTTTYSTYDGSLTTPGCNEVVHWINFLTPVNISASQLAMFRTLDDNDGEDIVDNFRPPQPLNGRTVQFFGAA